MQNNEIFVRILVFLYNTQKILRRISFITNETKDKKRESGAFSQTKVVFLFAIYCFGSVSGHSLSLKIASKQQKIY